MKRSKDIFIESRAPSYNDERDSLIQHTVDLLYMRNFNHETISKIKKKQTTKENTAKKNIQKKDK